MHRLVTPLAALGTVAVLGAAAPRALAAQTAPRRPVELGVDAALTADFADGSTSVALGAPVSRVRAAFPLGGRLALEPSLSFRIQHATDEYEVLTGTVEGVTSTTLKSRQTFVGLDADLGLLVHLGAARARADGFETRPYVRPFAGVQTLHVRATLDVPAEFDGTTDQSVRESDTRGRVGLGLGVRRRVGDRLALRVEGVASRTAGGDASGLASPSGATTTLALVFGLSFFTR